MDALKGGRYLLDALPHAARVLRKPLQVTFVGDGPDRQSWEDHAARLAKSEASFRILFTGWVPAETVDGLMAAADLLVVPSVWPEPFALVGLEAARHRLPVAAFAVGGIPEWLVPGVNGFLADGDPATPDGLAQAIVSCLQDEQTYARLREGAGRISSQSVYCQHVQALTAIFEQIVAA
jgi:glycosyltransferase involved in cell wall biosynthesis